ncbi:MAG: DUF935 family protein [Gammaproteobacteria bacterium]|nr:MAG: DUF935 family protein [Gammaproteobacteria bacterium]
MADNKTEQPELQEIATSRDGRDITRGWLSALMHAPIDDVIVVERGGGDYQVYADVLRDDRVRTGINQRIYGVIAKPWEVKPGGERPLDIEASNFIKKQLSSVEFDRITMKMLYGVFYGFSVGEAMVARDGARIVLDKARDGVKVRNRRRFAFDGEGNLRLKTVNNTMPGELMPDRKFIVATFGADHDDAPYGLGLAHYLYWLVWLKRNVTRFWAFYLDKFSSPTAVGKYPSGTDKPDQQKLLDALRAIQRDSAVVVPEGMEVILLEALKSSAADHKGFIDQMNEAILMVCLGQTATAQGTAGKLGGDTEREAVKDAILKADSDMLSEQFNRTIITWLTEWNFPGAVPPTVYRVFSDEDLNARIDRDVKISGMGFRPTLKYIQETYGGDWQESAAPATDGGANLTQSGDGGKKTAFAENDETDIDPTSSDSQTDILADQSADAGKVMLDKVRDLVDNAESLEQLRDDLLAAYGDLDSSQLVNVMELAFIAADLSGRYDVQEEK